jgi:hypothetical protein
MAEQVIIGCRLPHGLILHHPDNKDITVTIQGMNRSKIIGASHITTMVDAAFWNAWKAKHADYQPYKSGAIFESSTIKGAEDRAKELVKEKTGFEPRGQEAPGIAPATK